MQYRIILKKSVQIIKSDSKEKKSEGESLCKNYLHHL